MLTVLVPRERVDGETRVAATPDTIARMVKTGLRVTVESGAGEAAFFHDREYAAAGAEVSADHRTLWSHGELVLKVRAPGPNEALGTSEVEALRPEATLVGFLDPHRCPEAIARLAERRVTTFAMELIPRVSRAQGMDALSSQASIAGYKAVLLAAVRAPGYFPLLMTAAGTVRPAKVVVMGAGVAGLQAVATAKRLGATVEVSDIRPAVEEQVESLGARFIELPMKESGTGDGGYARAMGEDFLRQQRAIVKARIAACDVVITTALVPGKPAPRLVTADMVEAMRPGGVIVDLAVVQGGNCELSELDGEVVHDGVTILGPSNLPATMPRDASMLYSRNVLAVVEHLVQDGAVSLDRDDEITRGALLTHDGNVLGP